MRSFLRSSRALGMAAATRGGGVGAGVEAMRSGDIGGVEAAWRRGGGGAEAGGGKCGCVRVWMRLCVSVVFKCLDMAFAVCYDLALGKSIRLP